MGEMADYYLEQQMYSYDERHFIDSLDYFIYNKLWRKRTGGIIKISNMDSEHLQNTINMVNRNNPDSRILPLLIKELKTRNL